MLDENFIGKEFPQNCGDILKVIEKTDKQYKDKSFFYRCKFIKYPYEIFVSSKNRIIEGSILNPLIEQNEFIGQIFLQNCGDELQVLDKQYKGNRAYYKCQFQKYPCEVFALKSNIIKGTVNNPQIEQVEFIDKIWPQNCGDSLRIIEKTDKKQSGTEYLWKCKFINYPCEIFAIKKNIKFGQIDNPALPWKSKENLKKYIEENFKEKPTLQELSNLLNLSIHHLCNLINNYDLRDLLSYYSTVSSAEKDIQKYLLNSNIEFNKSNWNLIKDREIDIYIPSIKLGIEYNGSYWHSELYKSPNYHQEKSLLAKEKGIQLIHIFEYEWINKQEILEYLIKSKLGIFEKKIPARKCIIKELQNKEYQDFCNKNHLQGECGAKVKLGLFYQDELIQVMSFGVPRFTNKYEWEIIRECSKLGYIILGGKERLWKYFVKNYNPKDCISYCDFSKFTGNSYLKLGFEKISLNLPGFVWWDKESNQIFQRSPWKHKEMKEKYIRIFDAGQLVFKWTNFKVYLQII